MAWFEVNSHSLLLGLHLILFVVAQVSTATVPKCTDLGVSITETTIDSVLVGIWWLGHDNKVVYVQSNSYLVYRSTDEGRTWAQQNYKFNGKLLSHVIPTANPSKVYFLGIYGEWGVWRSSDAGETVVYDSTYSGYNRGIIFNMIYPHPYKEDFAIAWGYNEACNTGGPDPCGTNLFYTSNFGVEWHLVDTFTEEFTWAATELVEPDTSTNLVTILYTAWENKTIPSPYRDPTKYNLQVLRTDITHHTDSSADRITKSTVAEWTLGLFKSPENETVVFYYTPDSEGGQSLYVSEDDGETWNQAVFPTELQEHGWSVIDDAEGAVFLNVQGSSGATYGHVYSSQAWGEDYTVILKNNKRSSLGGVWGAADFIRVESMDGVYLANQYITDNINSHKPPSENDPVQSVITFDMGGSWHRLTPPANSCNNCFLHLNGPEESVYGRFYSIPAAVGVIVGTGNVGTHLNDSSVNTYLSRDAGVSWQEIQKGSWAYEIGDHGGILLLAPQSSEANGIVPGIANNTVLYSKDEGLNFQTCQFTDQTMQIYNMVIEPSSTSEVFILYGTRDESGVLAFIDFKNTYSRACQYPEKAGSASSDYELWSPTDPYSSSDCMLGRKTYYTRRKRDVNCYNPQEYETIVNSTNCPCTLEDYECDYCFEPDTSGSCVQICEQDIECNEEGYYMKSQGYRPVAGDTCDLKSGVDLMPIKTKCSSGHSDSGSSSGGGNVAGIVVAIIFVILAAGAAIGFVLYVYKYQKPDWVYERIFANRAHGNDYSSLNVDAMDEEPSTMFDESILTDTRVDEI